MGIKVPAPPKNVVPNMFNANCFMAPSLTKLKDITNAKPGDIGIYGPEINPKTAIFTGRGWVELKAPVSEPKNVSISDDLECPSCGAKQFVHDTGNWYKCEYCGNKYYIQ